MTVVWLVLAVAALTMLGEVAGVPSGRLHHERPERLEPTVSSDQSTLQTLNHDRSNVLQSAAVSSPPSIRTRVPRSSIGVLYDGTTLSGFFLFAEITNRPGAQTASRLGRRT